MISRLAGAAVLISCLVSCWQGCGGNGPGEVALPVRSEAGPVLARVGEFWLRPAEVGILSRQATELRRELGLEAEAGDPVDLAVEFLALLQLDGIADGKKRLLARAYLDRVFETAEPESVSDAELERAHEGEIKRYLTTGESDIYRPTFISADAIVVGCFPDLHPPEDDEEPVLTVGQARELAQEIAAACGGRVPDLDDFHSLAREFMSGRPTVEIKQLGGICADQRLARIHPKLHRAVTALKGNKAVSAPVEVPGAVYVIRRGVTDPGKGERPEVVRDELRQRVLQSRKRAALAERLSRLKERYRVRTWPGRLRGPEP